ncbi:MAG: tRNA (adenosine(37)-N6)-threonylcarbamoyltransferase complex dimerization subunit type 1 TsaB [Candidatus Omnitrophica bacterium]|nr:tRNA (adenosine(37)-N6)-threonylcarbamoyltransferase complex dimerization subunit type 1 TsaB [Candidatus Omnitrophota bacterium]
MKILAVDTSTRHLSIAVTDGDHLIAARNVPPKRDLSLSISFDIERALKKANLVLHDIDGFVIGLGPGSFTGLRVGMSMMKAFIMVTEKPVVGVSSLDAIAMNVRATHPVNVCVINDARRGLLYSCLYEKKDHGLVRRSEYLLQPVDEVLKCVKGETFFIGDGITHARDRIMDAVKAPGAAFSAHFETDKHWLPKAKELARLGYHRLIKGEHDNITTLAPLYLYPEDCQVTHRASGPVSHPEPHPMANSHREAKDLK